MVNFAFVPLSDPRLTPEMKASFLNVGQLVKWDYTDASGTYTGLIILGEKKIPAGFQSFADITFDIPAKEIPMAKIQEVSQIVTKEFRERTVVGLFKPKGSA